MRALIVLAFLFSNAGWAQLADKGAPRVKPPAKAERAKPAAKADPQKRKLEKCNASANGQNLTGEKRREFLSRCVT